MQGLELALGAREITSISIADEPDGRTIVAFAQGAPILMHADPEQRQELPADEGARTFAVLDRTGSLILCGSSKGLLCLLDSQSFRVLDALQVCPVFAWHKKGRFFHGSSKGLLS
jgi:hypothetical protein